MTNFYEQESYEDKRKLRRGWTTGACATAASKAAYIGFLTGQIPNEIEILLPGGQKPIFEITESYLSNTTSTAAVKKDAGDDPDVTHGAIVRVTIRVSDGLKFIAGVGVGIVSKPGLPINIGQPAINPEPRKMIEKNLQIVADQHKLDLGVSVEISIDNGAALAAKTWNPRLGIVGGLSILGTTGIVIPYSCAAWIASIHQGVDVARATGIAHVAACTGKTSEDAVTALYNLNPTAILDMGNFVGGMLNYLRTHPIPKVTIASGFGKLSKLAAGHMDLHSKRSQIDPHFLAQLAAKDGTKKTICQSIAQAESAGNILNIIERNNLELGDRVAKTAQAIAYKEVKKQVQIEILVYNRQGNKIGHAPFEDNIK